MHTGVEVFTRNRDKYPRQKFKRRNIWDLQWDITKVRIEDVIAIHKRLHPDGVQCRTVTLADDDVPESNSTKVSFQVVSLRFKGCRNIYPIRLVRPVGSKPSLEEVYREIITELNDLDMRVDSIVADAPKRAKLRRTKQFNARYGKYIYIYIVNAHCMMLVHIGFMHAT